MDSSAIAKATEVLLAARRSGELADRFPILSRPTTAEEANSIQEAVAAALGETIAGWKVARLPDFGLLRGIILQSRVFQSGAVVSAAHAPAMGVEAEIAFRFDRAMSPREAEYSRKDVEDCVSAFVAIEIVDSRFKEAHKLPVIERAADCMSNGGFVVGTMRHDWRNFDLSMLAASLLINGKPVVDRQIGGHVTKDPLILAITLANTLRATTGIAAGKVVTTGTFTGIQYAATGDRVQAAFDGFGDAVVSFV
ncbi:MAG TPA: fumarylacetoacetate hydrolase family protein [Magnetospirillaceae bacterium]|jgi:2-keto-4-pentenoate hydratase